MTSAHTGLRDALQFIYEIAGDGGGYTVNGQMVMADDLMTALADEHGIANENAGPLWSQIADRMEAPDPALEKAREAAWRTIDSAPKDGTQILVPMGYGIFDVVSWWGEAWREGSNGLAMRNAPTRWMPLPAPPVLSSLPEKEGERT